VRLRLIVLLAMLGVAVPAVALASRAKEREFAAHLSGRSEIPKAAPKGKANVSIKITGDKVCWKYSAVGGIDKPVVSHIHKGTARTAAGPVVVPLGGTFASKGCVTSTGAIVKAIEKNPAGYYVNIHTTKYPNGAVRGQLRADT
jgi:hypothetical protein